MDLIHLNMILKIGKEEIFARDFNDILQSLKQQNIIDYNTYDILDKYVSEQILISKDLKIDDLEDELEEKEMIIDDLEDELFNVREELKDKNEEIEELHDRLNEIQSITNFI